MEEIKHVFLGAGLFGHPQAFICNGQQPDLKVAALFSEKENALKNKNKQKKSHMYICISKGGENIAMCSKQQLSSLQQDFCMRR